MYANRSTQICQQINGFAFNPDPTRAIDNELRTFIRDEVNNEVWFTLKTNALPSRGLFTESFVGGDLTATTKY